MQKVEKKLWTKMGIPSLAKIKMAQIKIGTLAAILKG